MIWEQFVLDIFFSEGVQVGYFFLELVKRCRLSQHVCKLFLIVFTETLTLFKRELALNSAKILLTHQSANLTPHALVNVHFRRVGHTFSVVFSVCTVKGSVSTNNKTINNNSPQRQLNPTGHGRVRIVIPIWTQFCVVCGAVVVRVPFWSDISTHEHPIRISN